MAQDLQFTFRRPCLEVSGEIGSLAELIGYMQEESATLTAAFGDDMELVVQRIGSATGEPTKDAAEPKARKPRTTKPVEAVAPEPLPVPSAAPPAPPPPTVTTLPPNALPAAAATNPLDIPPYLQRPPAAVAPPPPTLPSPPTAPLAPTPPPVGVLGPKVVAALEVLRAGQSDGGQALADWLHGCGLTQKGATYDAACRVVLMTSDEKLGAIAEQLKVAA